MGPVRFYSKLRSAPLAATFGDFILLPGKATVEPSEVDVSTRLTPSVTLALPILSSPMDTVTEVDMAVGMARLGGLGVIHRNCSVKEQVAMAKAVKRAESFIISDVVTVSPKHTVSETRALMEARRISGLPVVEDGKLVGIVTKRDVAFADDEKKTVREIMTRDLVTVGPEVTPEEAKALMGAYKVEKLPVVDSEGRLLGLITAKDVFARESRPNSTRDPEGRLRVAAAVSPFDLDRAKALDPWVDILVIDVAHFHNENVMSAAAKMVREVSAELIVGNVGTREAAEEAISRVEGLAGLRVGVGSGSICTTGEVTGVAAPTLYAVAQAADAVAAHGGGISVVADGGVRGPGEAVKALAAGASAVMLGYALAGTKESPGQPIILGGRMYKFYRGMGSPSARQRRFALDRYSRPSKEIAEGVEGLVPYRGDLETVVMKFISGLKAAMGYAGASSIRELWERSRFALVTQTGLKEIAPHGVRSLEWHVEMS